MKLLTTVNDLDYKSRFELCAKIIQNKNLKTITEIGVYRGEFAEFILKECKEVEKYIMVDPWRNLDTWNKPANTSDTLFNEFYKETINRTEFAKHKINVLRGKTTEVVDEIEDWSIDFVYIDGDHTLKGITVDLISIWNKVKPDGYIAGDDFCPSIWQHDNSFEPTLVFPYAVYFAEAKNVKIYGLPLNQFLIDKSDSGFEFIDLTNGGYKETGLLEQMKIISREKKGSKIFKLFKK